MEGLLPSGVHGGSSHREEDSADVHTASTRIATPFPDILLYARWPMKLSRVFHHSGFISLADGLDYRVVSGGEAGAMDPAVAEQVRSEGTHMRVRVTRAECSRGLQSQAASERCSMLALPLPCVPRTTSAACATTAMHH